MISEFGEKRTKLSIARPLSKIDIIPFVLTGANLDFFFPVEKYPKRSSSIYFCSSHEELICAFFVLGSIGDSVDQDHYFLAI